MHLAPVGILTAQPGHLDPKGATGAREEKTRRLVRARKGIEPKRLIQTPGQCVALCRGDFFSRREEDDSLCLFFHIKRHAPFLAHFGESVQGNLLIWVVQAGRTGRDGSFFQLLHSDCTKAPTGLPNVYKREIGSVARSSRKGRTGTE